MLTESELEYIFETMTIGEYLQLDELSKGALKSYVKTAKSNLQYHSDAGDGLASKYGFTKSQKDSFNKHDKEAEKRYIGIKAATKKLTK
jgi:hypothetical protein